VSSTVAAATLPEDRLDPRRVLGRALAALPVPALDRSFGLLATERDRADGCLPLDRGGDPRRRRASLPPRASCADAVRFGSSVSRVSSASATAVASTIAQYRRIAETGADRP
jgi:hypothetical protein